MQIRDMDKSDIPVFVGWLKRFNDSFDFAGKAPINEAVATQFFGRFIDSASNFCVVAQGDYGEPMACLGFTILPHPWTGESVLFKAFWYCSEEHPGHGIKLLRHVVKLSRKGNISQVVIGSMKDRVSRLLEREGFKPIEQNYVLQT